MSFVEQELLTLPNQPNSPAVCSGVRVAQSLVSLLCLVIIVCLFMFFILTIVVLSILLPFSLWYLQFYLIKYQINGRKIVETEKNMTPLQGSTHVCSIFKLGICTSMKLLWGKNKLLVDIEPHRQRNGVRWIVGSSLECGGSWVRTPFGSNQRL